MQDYCKTQVRSLPIARIVYHNIKPLNCNNFKEVVAIATTFSKSSRNCDIFK
jgi:hypothetical protein